MNAETAKRISLEKISCNTVTQSVLTLIDKCAQAGCFEADIDFKAYAAKYNLYQTSHMSNVATYLKSLGYEIEWDTRNGIMKVTWS